MLCGGIVEVNTK